MKEYFKKVFFSLLTACLCGAICGRIVYSMYDKKLSNDIKGTKLYLVQSGTYSTYDNMVNNTLLSNYAYYEDEDGLYKSIVGITAEEENLEKLKNTYGEEAVITEYYSNDIDLNTKIKEYDNKLKMIDDNNKIKDTMVEMLAIYKDKNTTLVQMKS